MNLRQVFFIPILIVTAITACNKKQSSNPKPTTVNVVTINGNAYTTVVIGNQTWTSINYNGPGGVLYGDTTSNNPIFGKLYTYTEAEAIILPVGWRLPTAADFKTLIYTIDPNTLDGGLSGSYANTLISKTTWYDQGFGNNDSGFNAISAGYYADRAVNYGFQGVGTGAEFLSSSVDSLGNNESLSIEVILQRSSVIFAGDDIPLPQDRGSVRFVKSN